MLLPWEASAETLRALSAPQRVEKSVEEVRDSQSEHPALPGLSDFARGSLSLRWDDEAILGGLPVSISLGVDLPPDSAEPVRLRYVVGLDTAVDWSRVRSGPEWVQAHLAGVEQISKHAGRPFYYIAREDVGNITALWRLGPATLAHMVADRFGWYMTTEIASAV